MTHAVVFAGTIEGRKITEYLCGNQVRVTASVATEYGGELLKVIEGLNIVKGKLDFQGICDLLKEEKPEIVVDATHLYACEITANVKRACQEMDLPYLRILRDTKAAQGAVYVDTVKEGAEFLNRTEGNIFITTGSKELGEYTAVKDYRERCYARVLSLPQVVTMCDHLGFRGSHLMAMQGPFSKEMNIAMLKQVNASYLVTKESGTSGGFEEKCQAAAECGVTLVVIGKPGEEEGVSLKEGCRYLAEFFGFSPRQEIALVGIGMGNRDLVTKEASRWIEEADLLMGAKRMVEAVDDGNREVCYAYLPKDVKQCVKEHSHCRKIVVLVSGDVGFFSGAKKLLEIFEDAEVLPGISSLSYFCAKLRCSWEDVACASLHGKKDGVIGLFRERGRVFVILGKSQDFSELCRGLTDCGLGEVKVSLGEDLGYPLEKITTGKAHTFLDRVTSPLSVCLLETSQEMVCTCGTPDSDFIRGKVPMTKEEIRSIILSKLRLTKRAVVYDIGAGTGSVSVELARTACLGQVYAIEEKPEAVELILKNQRAFGCDNLHMIEGRAPEILEELPPPGYVFIGGSGGSLKEIVQKLLEKNSKVRIVVSAVSLETISEAFGVMRELEGLYARKTEVVAVSVAKSKALGEHHMILGQNPVYLFVSYVSTF
ncbi:MAG: precorrin-6A reductase [Roseburia sp.]|nr:precorrin-6A reductase [Roseburia sp.]